MNSKKNQTGLALKTQQSDTIKKNWDATRFVGKSQTHGKSVLMAKLLQAKTHLRPVSAELTMRGPTSHPLRKQILPR